MKTTGAFLLALLLLVPAIAFADEAKDTAAAETGHEGWYADFDEAAKVAKEQGKDLLVDFTGSDWCGWCIKLKKEVFDHAEFSDAAAKDYVFVALDYPRGDEAKAKVPNPARNQELVQKYGVTGFPTILLMTPDGTVYGRTGYKAGGPGPYVTHLSELRTKGKADLAEVQAFREKYDAATAEEKGALRVTAAEKLAALSPDSPCRTGYADVVKTSLSAEGVSAEQKAEAVRALFKANIADAEVEKAAQALDPKNEAGLYELAVNARVGHTQKSDIESNLKLIEELDAMGPLKDKKIAVNLYVNAAFWNVKFLSNQEQAKVWAQKAKDLGVEDARLSAFLDQILGS